MPAKITIRLQDGNVIEHEVQDYPGLASHPFTWDDSVEKFDSLVAHRIDERLSGEIKDAVRSLESIQVKDLMNLSWLGQDSSGERPDAAQAQQPRRWQISGAQCFINRRYHTFNLKERLNGYYTRIAVQR